MKRSAVFLFVAFLSALRAVSIAAQATNAVGGELQQDMKAKNSISVSVDDDYKRPLLRFAPPRDKNGDTPQEVMKKFLACIDKQDIAGARKLCHLKQGKENAWETMGEERFASFCKNFGAHVKSVKISGSAVNDKEDYWCVFYNITTVGGEKVETRRYLTRVKGNWCIIESPNWKDIAEGDFERFYW